jgi:hypothetical protein
MNFPLGKAQVHQGEVLFLLRDIIVPKEKKKRFKLFAKVI